MFLFPSCVQRKHTAVIWADGSVVFAEPVSPENGCDLTIGLRGDMMYSNIAGRSTPDC